MAKPKENTYVLTVVVTGTWKDEAVQAAEFIKRELPLELGWRNNQVLVMTSHVKDAIT